MSLYLLRPVGETGKYLGQDQSLEINTMQDSKIPNSNIIYCFCDTHIF